MSPPFFLDTYTPDYYYYNFCKQKGYETGNPNSSMASALFCLFQNVVDGETSPAGLPTCDHVIVFSHI